MLPVTVIVSTAVIVWVKRSVLAQFIHSFKKFIEDISGTLFLGS